MTMFGLSMSQFLTASYKSDFSGSLTYFLLVNGSALSAIPPMILAWSLASFSSSPRCQKYRQNQSSGTSEDISVGSGNMISSISRVERAKQPRKVPPQSANGFHRFKVRVIEHVQAL
ncbi:hypothetical protein ABIB90_007691 [Bradyrhizobium sp. JR4.1]